ncbi:beta-lactamase family protein [Alkalibacter rhizosphaerae]|uniref:Beta-lactamase family protein n=2 Tax=Alkalibacter rhizosphaerae TaxID=2815577 RepID=A0A974XJP7_9FIRM|nr:beta-lactamase family protein [Alkalibacter rhizosphaerae]
MIGIICLVVFPPWDGICAWITPLPDTVQEQVDDAISSGLDGIIVYVDEAGQPPAFYTAGWKDRDNQIPADPQSFFKIGSIGKLYDAVAVTKLVNDERLYLDKTLADYLPELAERIEYADQITLRMMVQHRSGIPNITDQPGYRWDSPPETNIEALALVLDMPADFKPDEKYSYSNTNYLLISEIIEKVLGYSNFQYIKEEILSPLGLENTFGSIRNVNLDDVMSGYYVGVESDFKQIDAGMVATAEDVGIFLRALNDGSLLNDNEQAVYSSIYVYGHTGWVLGYQSFARYHKDIDTVVVQFVNTTGGTPILPFFDTQGGTKVMVSEVVYDRIVRILRKEINLNE